MEKIKIGIVGYGHLGKGVEIGIEDNPDMELVGIFTRRNPGSIKTKSTPAYSYQDMLQFKDKIDVMILCGGSATDLREQGPFVANNFNTVDSFDTHQNIPAYFEDMNHASKNSQHLSLISTGWDPGLFSLMRLLFESILPKGITHTFWGKGVSQGHSDALRRIPGIKDAVQYTIPSDEVMERIRNKEEISIPSNERHKRQCFVVIEDGADKETIEKSIETMPNYFADYETSVCFISEDELHRDHASMPHGGNVMRLGTSPTGSKQFMNFSLDLDSNPEFTAAVNIACARAAYRLYTEGKTGAFTIADVPFSYLSSLSLPDILAKIM